MPQLERITLHPVKSLDGLDVDRACVLPCGALVHDRRWRLVDLDGGVVNAKRTPLIHRIRAEFELSATPTVRLSAGATAHGSSAPSPPAPDVFPLLPGPTGPSRWLSASLGMEVLLQERPDGGFPDDRDAAGLTLVSRASLAEVARWFSLPIAEVRRRFRANLEVGDCEPFWEDTLASPAVPLRPTPFQATGPATPDELRQESSPLPPLAFRVGGAGFTAVNACRRCPVPTRNSTDGTITEHFREVFEAWRRRRIPRDVDTAGWGSYYRLAINTVGDGQGGNVQVGDRIEPVAHPGVS